MSLSEFDLIQRYFNQPTGRADVVLGVGDDAALLRVPPDMELAVAMDTLVEDVHFPAGTDPRSLGHKVLAVNLSDLAAMGARPAWATLALTLPRAEAPWLAAFAQGFLDLAARWDVALVGGDTTRGPLTVTVQAHGLVPAGQALRRSGACPGDLVYVTGTLGDAALGLALVQGRISAAPAAREQLTARLERPEPRVAAGQAVLGLARAAIDISDGLAADLGHILAASGVGATVDLERLPRSTAFRETLERRPGWEAAWDDLPLAGGDDYELCIVVPPAAQSACEAALAAQGTGFAAVGVVEAEPGLRCRRGDGSIHRPTHAGYRHFA